MVIFIFASILFNFIEKNKYNSFKSYPIIKPSSSDGQKFEIMTNKYLIDIEK
jgi:hypothetical protein